MGGCGKARNRAQFGGRHRSAGIEQEGVHDVPPERAQAMIEPTALMRGMVSREAYLEEVPGQKQDDIANLSFALRRPSR